MMPALIRKDKVRRKSRLGCRNCKLRKVKCDETRPNCKRCQAYGVRCDYGFHGPNLQPCVEVNAKKQRAHRLEIFSLRRVMHEDIWVGHGKDSFRLDLQDKELFDHFRYQTIYSLGSTAIAEMYESFMLQASFTCPFLLHGCLAVASIHRRYLGLQPAHRRSVRETHHWCQCTSQFNRCLNQPIKEELKDVIWATAGIVAILTFSSINMSSPEHTWPLGLSDSEDLQWLHLGSGKMKIWRLVDPSRPGSVFRKIAKSLLHIHEALPERGIDGILPELTILCGLNASSNVHNSPYFSTAHALSRFLKSPLNDVSLGRALLVSNHMHGEFIGYLEKKDPVALKMLSLWYSKARGCVWWIDFRARYEVPAISGYLQQHHGDMAMKMLALEDTRRLIK